MDHIVLSGEAREIDSMMINKLQIPGILLMEQAAVAVAGEVAKYCSKERPVLCVCGGGNNGGDGWAAARILMTRGYRVFVCATTLDLPDDAKTNTLLFRHTGSSVVLSDDTAVKAFFREHADAGVIVDALFGIGLTREPAGIYRTLIEEINAHSAKVVSVDIPSGVFCDTGACSIAVQADSCVTFQYAKPCHYLFPGREHTGRLTVAPIGVLSQEPSSSLYVENTFSMPARPANSNMGTYGRLGIIAGSRGMSGAAVMAARAAVAGGAGLTTVFTCGYTADVLQNTTYEVMAKAIGAEADRIKDASFDDEIQRMSALSVGMGLGVHPDLSEFLRTIAASDIPKVIDADGLNILACGRDSLRFGQNTVITPHPVEFSRISGVPAEQVLADPIGSAAAFAQRFSVIVLLKGATTTVTDGRTAVLVTRGTPAMAKGGSGDVLSGVIGALLAQGLPCLTAAYGGAIAAGAAAERAAAEKGEYAPTALDTIRHIAL